MDKESLIFTIIIGTDFIGTRHTTFSTSGNNKFTFIHICKVDSCFIAPKLVKFQRTLITEDIIVEVIVNMIAVGRSLPLDNDQILNVCTQRIILLQIKYRPLDFLSGILNLLTYGICLGQIKFG